MITIGLFINEIQALRNWELRLIDGILKNPSLELCLLIKNGEANNTQKEDLKAGNHYITNRLLHLQIALEARLFKSKQSVDRTKLIDTLNDMECLNLRPTSSDVFAEADIELIKKHELDLILYHGEGRPKGKFLDTAKHGIWKLQHGLSSSNPERIGFWETLEKKPVVEVQLHQISPDADKDLILDKGFYNRHWAFYETQNIVLEGAVDMVLKNIRLLQNDTLVLKKKPPFEIVKAKNLNLGSLLRYMSGFYVGLASKIWEKVLYILLGRRYRCWTIFIGEGTFSTAVLPDLKPIQLPKGEFWADPFLFQYQKEQYVFFENYPYKERKGKISCGRIVGEEVVEVIDILDTDYHLSYPYVFAEEDTIFMMPESSGNKRLEIYKCIDFPAKWELFSTAFEGEEILDTTYFRDERGERWLFLNKKGLHENSSALYIYKIDSLEMNAIESHAMNPVIIDSRIARGGGAIFKYENQFVRPSQNNSNAIYGYGFNLSKIKKLDLDNYEEEKIAAIEPGFFKGISATHHLHQIDGHFVIDGAYHWI